MKKRARAKVAAATTPPQKRRSRRPPRPAPIAAAVALVVALAGAWFTLGPGRIRNLPPTEPRVALDSAAAAIARGDYDRAFAVYRAAIREHPEDGILVGAYAAAVNNRSFAVRPSRGRMVPLAPTSHDRVSTALEVLALYAESERLRPQGGEAALQRGITLANWGLPEDALVELFRAKMQGGTQPEIDGIGATITLLQLGRGDEVDARAIRPARAAP